MRQEVRPWRTLDGGGLNFELLAEVAKRTGTHFDPDTRDAFFALEAEFAGIAREFADADEQGVAQLPAALQS